MIQLDLQTLLATEFGRLAQDLALKPEVEAKLAAVEAMFSLNPLRDIQSVTLSGASADRKTAVVYVQGTFDKHKLLTILRAADGYTETPYREHSIRRWTDKKDEGPKDSFGCFARDDLIVVSEGEAALKSALDCLDGRAKSLAEEPVLAEWAQAQRGSFLLAAARGIRDTLGVQPKAAVLRHADDLMLSVGEENRNVVTSATLTSHSEESAANMRLLIQGLQAFAALSAADNPRLAELARNLEVMSDGRTLKARLTWPVEAVIELVKEGMKRGAQGEGA
jgi:hypothetical protein